MRNDGIIKIYSGKLEQGIWELEEASQIGALDNQAAGAITLGEYVCDRRKLLGHINWPEAIRILTNCAKLIPTLAMLPG